MSSDYCMLSLLDFVSMLGYLDQKFSVEVIQSWHSLRKGFGIFVPPGKPLHALSVRSYVRWFHGVWKKMVWRTSAWFDGDPGLSMILVHGEWFPCFELLGFRFTLVPNLSGGHIRMEAKETLMGGDRNRYMEVTGPFQRSEALKRAAVQRLVVAFPNTDVWEEMIPVDPVIRGLMEACRALGFNAFDTASLIGAAHEYREEALAA